MRNLKLKSFENGSIEQKLVDFINENGIKQEDILKISFSSVHFGIHLNF